MITLKELPVGEKAKFVDSCHPDLLLKMNQMGIFPGDVMEIRKISPWGSSLLVEVKDKFEFVIDSDNAGKVFLQLINQFIS